MRRTASSTRGCSGETYGHAIEVRLYAEDPSADWQPQSGCCGLVEVPGVDAEFDLLNRPGLRLDSGFESGSEVSTHYDAMLAKVISWAPTREAAARRLADALAKSRIHGLVTNRDLLVDVLRHPAFLAADLSTDFFDRTGVRETSRQQDPGAAVAAALALAERRGRARTVQAGIPVGWRNVVSQPQTTEFEPAERTTARRRGLVGHRDGYLVDGYDVLAVSPDGVVLRADGVSTSYDVSVSGDRVDVDSARGHVRLTRVPRFTDPADAVASGSLLAPMPGTVIAVNVAVGDRVEAGQPVLVLEAMKMQHTVAAPYDGVVTVIDVVAGAQVASGEVLAVVEGEES